MTNYCILWIGPESHTILRALRGPTNHRIVCWLMIWPSKSAVALLTEISTAAFLDRRYTVMLLTAMKCTVPKKSMHASVHAFRRRLRIYASICTIPPAISAAASSSLTRPHRTCTGNSNFVIIFAVPWHLLVSHHSDSYIIYTVLYK